MAYLKALSGLASCFLVGLLVFPYSGRAIVGRADVMSALYIDERTPGCDSNHIRKDCIYLTPNTSTSSTDSAVWTEVVAGDDLLSKYKVLTGDIINVTYKSTSSGSRRMLSDPAPELDSIDVVLPSQGHEIFTGTQIKVKGIIYLISMCGWNASLTIDEARSLFFTSNFSIAGYHDTCTYSKVAMNESDWYILPVTLPCAGVVYNGVLGYPYRFNTSCGGIEQFAWRQLSDNIARQNATLGAFFNATRSRRIVHILPKQAQCGFAGLGNVGCDTTYCSVWIQGNSAKSLPVIMHELGHTQGLSHAGRGASEYGDYSDVMGTASSNGYLCMNVGNQFRVGWNKPVAVLYPNTTNSAQGTVPANGTGSRWVIPATYLNDTNYVYLLWAIDGYDWPNLFISFRSRASKYDNILGTTYNNKVYVHNFNGTADERDYNRTDLLAVLGQGATYVSPFVDLNNNANYGGGVRITVANIVAGQSATVQLCRFTQLVESGEGCRDGVDNDCDGLVDGDDPSCQFPPPPVP